MEMNLKFSKFLSFLNRVVLNKKTRATLFFIGLFSLPYILYLSLGLSVLKGNFVTIFFALYGFVLLTIIASFFRSRFLSAGSASVLLLIGLAILPIFILSVFDLVNFAFQHTLITLFGYAVFLSCSIISFFRARFIYVSFLGIGFLSLGLFLEGRSWREENVELCEGLRSDIYCMEKKDVFDCVEQSSFGPIYVRSSVCPRSLSQEEQDASNRKKKYAQKKKKQKTKKRSP